MKFDCELNVANIGVEWLGISSTCIIASMYINLNEKDEEYLLELEEEEINKTKTNIGSNLNELSKFEEAVGKNDMFSFT